MSEQEPVVFYSPWFWPWSGDDVEKLGKLAWLAWGSLDHDHFEWLISEIGCTLEKMEIKPDWNYGK